VGGGNAIRGHLQPVAQPVIRITGDSRRSAHLDQPVGAVVGVGMNAIGEQVTIIIPGVGHAIHALLRQAVAGGIVIVGVVEIGAVAIVGGRQASLG